MSIGEIKIMATTQIDAGHLVCDGASYPIADYPVLFAKIGTTFGGDDTSFKTPNLIGRFLIGGYNIGAVAGQSSATITTNNLPAHGHDLLVGTSTNGGVVPAAGHSLTATASGSPTAAAVYTSSPTSTVPLAGVSQTGGGQPLMLLPPCMTLLPVIQAL